MFGNIKSTGNKAILHMIEFWVNVHMKEKILWGGPFQGRLSEGETLSEDWESYIRG